MIKRKKILAISSSNTGGGPSHIFFLNEILQDEVDIYLAMPKIDLTSTNFNSNKYLQISERRISIKDIFKLIVFAKKNKIDIIHSHGKGAGLLGRIIKIFLMKPLIYTFHGIHTECLNKYEKIIYILYENITGFMDDEKIFVSKSERDQAKKLKIFFKDNYSIINNASKEMNFQNDNLKNQIYKMSFGNSKINIVSICRLVEQKNIFEIFDIAKYLPNYNFLILGDGILYNKSKEYIKKKGIKNVFLLGKQKEIYKYLYSAELFLSTSLYEGHPISVIEAISVGIPVIASNVTGNCDTIKHGYSGFFYKLGDVKEASNFIEKIINNPDLRKKLSINAFNTHRELFSTKKLKKSYTSIYRKY